MLSSKISLAARSELLMEQLEDSASSLTKYLESVMLNLVLKELDLPARKQFINLLTDPASKEAAMVYAEGNIRNFNEKLQAVFQKAIKKLLDED